MNEPAKGFFNGNTQIYLKVIGLTFQGMIVAGVFWVGATFQRKTDFETYKLDQENKRIQLLEALSKNNEIMARIDERLKARENSGR